MSNYKGKRIAVTVPVALYERLEKIAATETRPIASTALVLLEEAIKARESGSP